MSRKIENNHPDLSTEVVDKVTGEITNVYVPPKLNKAGMEVPSAITLTAIPAMRDFDLGIRIRRYMQAPQSVQARYDDNDPQSDDYDFDNVVDTDEVNPMTPHELRFGEVQNQFRDKEKERIKQLDDRKAEKLKADKEAFKNLYKTLREEGAIPPVEPTPKDA